jgi:hypothetical protein
MAEAQFYYGLQTDFGKSRVQYKEFNWTSYQYERFDTYYYREGKPLSHFVAKSAHQKLKEIQKQLSFLLEKRIQFVIYNTFSDFKQSNIGYKQHDEYNIGGKTQIVGTKVLLYFDGDYNHLKKQIAAGITKILLNEMMYGGNMADAFTNSTLLNLPDWFVDGLIAFIANPWNMQMILKILIISKKKMPCLLVILFGTISVILMGSRQLPNYFIWFALAEILKTDFSLCWASQ